MRLTSLVAAVAAITLVAVPAFAVPSNPAAGLSLVGGASGGQSGGDAAASTAAHSGKLSGSTLAIAGLAAAAVIGGAVALGTSHHHDNMPASN